MVDVAIPSNNIKKKEHEKPEKYQRLKRGSRKDVEREGNSGGSGKWGT